MVGGTDESIVWNAYIVLLETSDEIGGSNGMMSLLMTKFVSCYSSGFSEVKYSRRYFDVPALDGDLMGRGLFFCICHSF